MRDLTIDKSRLRGLTPRTMYLLDLDAVYEGTQYQGRQPWELEIGYVPDQAGPVQLCARDKEPVIKAGVVREKVDTVLRMVCAEGRFPTITIEGEGIDEKGAAKLVAQIIDQGRLKAKYRKPMRDGLVKGAGVLAYSILEPSGRIEIHKHAPEWCEAILVCMAGRPRAAEIAAEMERLQAEDPLGSEIVLEPPAEGQWLFAPDEADSNEVCWVRYEHATHEAARVQQGVAADAVYRARIDYTPTQVIYYRPLLVGAASSGLALGWEIDRVETHGYGAVPVAWARGQDAEDGETEGPSIINEQLLSVAEAADYALTRKDEAVGVVSNPKAYTIGLVDLVADFNASQGKPTDWGNTSTRVLSFLNARAGEQGSIGLLEPTGAGPTCAREHLQDLDERATRITGILNHDPKMAEGVASGTALERRMQPTLAVAGDLQVFGSELLANLVGKIARAKGFVDPVVKVQWGPLIDKTSTDRQAEAQALLTATGGNPVLSQETATRMAAGVFGVEDPEQEWERLQGAGEAAVEKARREVEAQLAREAAAKKKAEPPPVPGDSK